MKKKKKIQLLPPELTNQIAAGEVVERPASVVKELVENALDAHASDIVVTIENGGQSLIAVEDNGIGIAKDELELAVTRHATSKLQDIAGLSHIASYGFRGEALPSIASVSSFSIVSRYLGEQEQNSQKDNTQALNTINSVEAAQLRVEFGKVHDLAPSAWQKGTRIEVRDLFFNIPARLKFLKSPATELKKSTELFVRLALVAKNATLSLYAGSRLVHSFKKTENTKERLAHIWPPVIVDALLPVDYKSHGMHITGFISHPRSHQPRADRMLYYVNGRAVSDKILMRATKQAFQGKLTTRDYPQCFLCIDLAPEEVDVNVHPAKNEVRFRDEQNVFVTILRALSLALEKDTRHFSAKHLGQNPQNESNALGEGNHSCLNSMTKPLEQGSFNRHKTLTSQDEENPKHAHTMQESRLGDLYVPKPKGFWGDMDKEQGLSFIKEEAERKRQEAQNTPIHEDGRVQDWRVVDSSREQYTPCEQTTFKEDKKEYQEKTVSRRHFAESHMPIEPLPDDYNEMISKQYPHTNTLPIDSNEEYKQHSLHGDREQEQISSSVGVDTNRASDLGDVSQGISHVLSREEEQILYAKKASVCLPQGLIYVGQIAKTYLILQKFDASNQALSLILLDQHAIHERILYEDAKKGLVNAQNLLLPLEFPLHKSERIRLEELLPLLEKLAFKVEMTPSSCKIYTIPATLTKVEAIGFLKDVFAQKTDDLEKIWISHSCKSALKANTELDTQSALKLILRWLQTEEPDYCPHGRPCVLHFDAEILEQMFKRKA